MHKMSDRDILGLSGELFVYTLLSRVLPTVKFELHYGYHFGDMVARHDLGWSKIEVKTARKNKRGNHQFNLYKSGHTDYRHADVIVLLALNDCGNHDTYVIPTRDITGQSQITITRNSKRYKQYYNRLDLLVSEITNIPPYYQ
jgi:hypothetical protein